MDAEHLGKTLSGLSVTGNKFQSKAETFIDSLQLNAKMSSSHQLFQYTLVVLLLHDKKRAPSSLSSSCSSERWCPSKLLLGLYETQPRKSDEQRALTKLAEINLHSKLNIK